MSDPKPIHNYPAKIPEPLFREIKAIATDTGISVNSLIVQSLENSLTLYQATAPGAEGTVNSVDLVRSSYASPERWSSPHNSYARLAGWSFTDEYERAIGKLSGKDPDQ